MFKTCGVIFAAALLAACGAPPVRPPPNAGAGKAHARQPGTTSYRIDSARSELRLLVYRAGPLARLGHNHVIVNRVVTGWIDAAESVSGSSFSLEIPVADFVVDDPDARAEEGADFAADVTDDAKSKTRYNMLSAALLDADRFSTITLTGVAVTQATGTGTPATWAARLIVQVAGHESRLVVPFVLETAEGRASAFGTAVVRQSDLGLAPFSVMLGALRVEDEITIKFRVIALVT
jgi:hypothetical protein